MRAAAFAIALAFLTSCGARPVASLTPLQETPAAAAPQPVYQPLAAGDVWKYTCNHQFPIENAVLGTLRVGGKLVYEFSIQIPSSPSRSVKVVQLLANDSGTTRIYGYLLHGKVKKVVPAAIVVPSPVLNQHYDYPSPRGGKISRIFVGFENTNPTPLGTFRVAPYFESGSTHNYGYALGRGIMEEDHGPHFEFDCLIDKVIRK